jgi:hypothetical protein
VSNETAPFARECRGYYVTDSRNHRLNVQLVHVNRSPVSSAFGYYVGGQRGNTFSVGFSVFF